MITWKADRMGGTASTCEWVYIATPSGAALGRTIKLAKGGRYLQQEMGSGHTQRQRARVFGVGLVRRRDAA